jgi:hypothetical protein
MTRRRDFIGVTEGLCATGSRWFSPCGRSRGPGSARAEARHDGSGPRVVPMEMGVCVAHPAAHHSHQGNRISGRAFLVMPCLGPSGTIPVGLGKTLPGAQRNQSIKHRRRVSRSAGELVSLASRNSPAPVAGGDHVPWKRKRPSRSQQRAMHLRTQCMPGDSEASMDRQSGSRRKLGPSQSEKGRYRYVRIFPLWAQVTQKRLDLVNQAQGERWHLIFVVFFARPRPGGVVGAPPADRSRFHSLCGPLPGSLRGVRAPPGASAIARHVPGRHDPPAACTLRPRRGRAVTAVTAVIAVTAVSAGIVLPGPVQAARTVAKGGPPCRP